MAGSQKGKTKPILQDYTISKVKTESKTCKTIVLLPKRKAIEFLPGQFINLYFPKGGNPLGICRSYTIASPPGEKGISVTFRLKGEFTKLLWEMKKGDTIKGLGPLGNFVFDHRKFKGKNVVFIAGGIGSAGFTSALRQIERDRLPVSAVTFVYSERNHEDVPFLSELRRMKRLRLFTTLTGSAPKNWDGMTGRIDIEKLKMSLTPKELSEGAFFVCGSDLFVKDVAKTLLKLKVSKGRIFSEGFG